MTRRHKTTTNEEVDYQSGPIKKLGYITQLARTISKEEKISFTVIMTEIATLFLVKRLGPLLYFEARLWRRDLSLREKLGFMNGEQYRARVAELNPPLYQKFSQHKLVEKSILTLLGLPTPKFIGFLHPVKGCTPDSSRLTNAEELSDLLMRQELKRVCFKVSEGWGGRGFTAAEIHSEDGRPVLRNLALNDGPASVAEFIELYLQKRLDEGMVLEEYIEQHEVLEALNSSSVNTLRIWLIQRPDGVRLIGAFLRMGRKAQVVDNAEHGGVISIVDTSTGVLGPVMTPTIIPRYSPSHPDSNIRTDGLQLPFWPECVDLAKQALRVFPRASFTGLDMAITQNGPMIVELNLQPSKISARNFGAPTSELLS